MKTIQQRFDEKWAANADGCHIWTGTRYYHGYGKLRVRDTTMVAHRVAWFLATTHWPTKAEVVFQTCGNHACVNYEHLVLVPKDSRDLKAIEEILSRTPQKRGFGGRKDPTMCKAGLHPWVPENIRIINRGPSCIECNRLGNKSRASQRAWLKRVERA